MIATPAPLLVGTQQFQGNVTVSHSRQTTLAQVSLLQSHGPIGLGPTLEALFNLNYLPEVPPPNPIVRLGCHPLNTSQKGD